MVTSSVRARELGGTPVPDDRQPRPVDDIPARADRLFAVTTTGAGLSVLVLLTLVGLFLLLRSDDAFRLMGGRFFTTSEWRTDTTPVRIGVLGLVVGTVEVALVAVAVAIPLGICAALFITEYSSPRWRSMLTGLVDLLAAIPSLLYGLWGAIVVANQLTPLSQWLADHGGWIPIFRVSGDNPQYQGSIFIAGLIVSLMVLPIIAAITREVFAQTPPGEKEAALALGGTRWGMVRMVVLPYGRSGIIGGSMLGLGRALGETIAVTLLLPQAPIINGQILKNGGATVSGFIANSAGVIKGITVSGLMAAGLVLFLMTLLTNMFASVIVNRSRSGVGVEL
jgi:phosphate transport system permease protein